MIKIFKWYIVSDLDLFIEKDTACRTLSRRIKYLEKENENLYFENGRLRNKQVQVTNIIEPKDITAKKYISEDKIREKIKNIEDIYKKEMKPYQTEYGLNVSLLSKKEKEELINKRNGLLIQKITLEELLEEN